MAFITVEKGNKSDIGKKFPLGKNTVLIGRKTAESNPDISLDDEFVSRRHAEILFDKNTYTIRDLNSTNGTSLDGQHIEPGKFYPLKDNTTIGLGIMSGVVKVLLRFRMSLSIPTTRLTNTNITELNPVSWLRIGDKLGEVWIDGKQISLPKKEYELIVCLYNRAGKVCTRKELITEVWPEVLDGSGVSDAAIDQLVHRLRYKIEIDPAQPKRLISQRGFGYMLI
jgi:two-component system response regulator QseB